MNKISEYFSREGTFEFFNQSQSSMKYAQEEDNRVRDQTLLSKKGGKFLKKPWCCVGGSITR